MPACHHVPVASVTFAEEDRKTTLTIQRSAVNLESRRDRESWICPGLEFNIGAPGRVPGQTVMEESNRAVRVLVGTRKGAFVLTSDGKRRNGMSLVLISRVGRSIT